MKKALEAALVLACLGLGAYVLRTALARRAAAARLVADPASGPGIDAEDPSAPPPGAQRRGVTSMPGVRLTRPPKPSHRAIVPPPPEP
jgi:hypothetical protein